MYCSNCGAPVDPKAYACISCGLPIKGSRNFCTNCGAAVQPGAAICTGCGVPINSSAEMPEGGKDWLTTLLLCIFVGAFGIHRFYTNSPVIGVIQLLTGGGCGIWAIVDLIMIITGSYRDGNGNPLYRKQTDIPAQYPDIADIPNIGNITFMHRTNAR